MPLISGWGGGKKKMRGFDPGVSRSETALSITRGFWEAHTFAVMMLSSVEEEGTPKFPSCGQHLTAPKPEAPSWICWTIFKTGLRSCCRPSSVKCDPSRICTSETAEILQVVGQIFKAKDHTGSQQHFLKWPHCAGHKINPAETQPRSTKIPKSWRGLGAMERTGSNPAAPPDH